MINVWEFSTVAAENDSAPPDGAPEGMARSAVNDTLREFYAAIARFRNDISGVGISNTLLTVTGTGSAYLLTTNQAPAALENGFTVKFTVGAGLTNTGSVTLNLDTTGAKVIQGIAGTNLAGGELVAGSSYTVTFHQPSNAFILHDFFKDSGISSFPAGTRMLFQQTAAPTSWVKDVSALAANKALRLTNGTVGTGGSTVFTSVFAARTILQANLPAITFPDTLTLPNHGHTDTFVLPSHIHPFSGSTSSDGAHSHPYDDAGSGTNTFDASGGSSGATPGVAARTTDSAGAHAHSVSGNTGTPSSLPAIPGAVGNPTSLPAIPGSVTSGGSGTALNFDVSYVDVIIAVKS